MVVVAGNYAYLCGMRKLLCPQCKIAALYVVNDRKERLLVYVLEMEKSCLKIRQLLPMVLI